MNVTAPETPAVPLDDAAVVDELVEVARRLLEDTKNQYSVFYYAPERLAASSQTWIIVERDGNVGTLHYGNSALEGYTANFVIKPSRETGSSLLVSIGEGSRARDPRDVDEMVQAAHIATRSSYKNFATTTALPNHGWQHFDWAAGKLVRVTLKKTETD